VRPFLFAPQACLLTLGRHSKQLYPDLKSILVYPSSFSGGPKGIFGTDLDANISRLGESWQSGSVVLAWDSSRRGVLNPSDGKNVIIHEFAHQLDDLSGQTDGAPALGRDQSFADWARIFVEAYERHLANVEAGRRTVLDPYGADGHEEFFAVAVEAFFETPAALKGSEPEVYDQLARYFRLDPAGWA